ncbi:hypothetical protein [Frigoriglobus tundricola]|uniref:Uncharacterized protein n=1 Tax=Frigoriglobus tundricola TaxID=2774151 RepID=A0A6M5Z3J8_9BACT|nr:hypothetical protein [Frigoriglobus tundricola]QJX00295.1 hypothetical protein FTUN_7920 [Frigoriglobus tundricola]
MRRTVLAVTLLTLGTAGWAALRSAAPDPNPPAPMIVQLYPKGPTDGLLWPHNNTRLLSVRLPNPEGKTKGATAVIRTIQEKVDKDAPPVIGSRRLAQKESKTAFELGRSVRLADDDPPLAQEVILCIQIIDLDELQKRRPNDPGRYKLRFGMQEKGSTMFEGGDKCWIEGHLAGTMPHLDAKWKDGELHVMNFFVKNGETFTVYDVVVRAPE